MDESERIAERYLKSAGFGEVKYEPDGNVPPDFLVDGRIAIEVRRLNQNHECTTGKAKGREEVFIPFFRGLEQYLPTIAPSQGRGSWYVVPCFSRPLEKWPVLRQKINAALLEFARAPSKKPSPIHITPHLELLLDGPTEKFYPGLFVLGAALDEDQGGGVLSEVLRNLAICVPEKQAKVAAYRAKYPEWWLVLTNHIGHTLTPEDQCRIRDLFQVSNTFDKIILVNRHDPADAFEI